MGRSPRSRPCQRLATVRGSGPINATALVSSVGDPRNACQFAAWLELTATQRLSGGKNLLQAVIHRRHPSIAAIALGNKTARIAWVSIAIAQEVASMANRSDGRLQILLYPAAASRSHKGDEEQAREYPDGSCRNRHIKSRMYERSRGLRQCKPNLLNTWESICGYRAAAHPVCLKTRKTLRKRDAFI
nr:transposase [Paraburkholderia sp. BL8N3]